MQRETSIGSRVTWYLIAAIILVATFLMGLRYLPAWEELFIRFGLKAPRVTKAVFTFGPAALVTIGVIAAVLMVMGNFTPELRGARVPLILLVVVLMSSALAGVFMPIRMSCCCRGEIISPTVPTSTSPAQPTNAP